MHLLREPVRFHAVACGGHELLRERAGHDADDADYRDDYVFCHGLLSLGCGSQGYGLPIVKAGGHTVTTDADGTFLIKVGFPDGRKPDYCAYMVGPFGANFQDEDGYIVHNWGTSQTDSIRFRIYSAKYQRWVGRVAIFGYWVAVWNALPIS